MAERALPTTVMEGYTISVGNPVVAPWRDPPQGSQGGEGAFVVELIQIEAPTLLCLSLTGVIERLPDATKPAIQGFCVSKSRLGGQMLDEILSP